MYIAIVRRDNSVAKKFELPYMLKEVYDADHWLTLKIEEYREIIMDCVNTSNLSSTSYRNSLLKILAHELEGIKDAGFIVLSNEPINMRVRDGNVIADPSR